MVTVNMLQSQEKWMIIAAMEIWSATYTVIDVETTGLSPAEGERVCEIGAMKLRNGKPIGSFHTLVDPQRPVSPGAFATNQITAEMLRGVPVFDAIVREVYAFISDTVLVAQNASFDLGFINSELTRASFPRWNGYVVDTISLARKAIPGLPTYKLDRLAQEFNVTFTSRHRSMGDVEATAEIFLKCVALLREKEAVRTLEDLLTVGKPWRK